MTGFFEKTKGTKAICQYCGKEFYKFNRARSGRRASTLRKSTDKTCSSKCSKLNIRAKAIARCKKWYVHIV